MSDNEYSGDEGRRRGHHRRSGSGDRRRSGSGDRRRSGSGDRRRSGSGDRRRNDSGDRGGYGREQYGQSGYGGYEGGYGGPQGGPGYGERMGGVYHGDDAYGERRQELREHGQSGYGARPEGYGQGGGYGNSYGGGRDDDYSGAHRHAMEYAGHDQDSGLFGNALSMLSGGQNRQNMMNDGMDEHYAHQQYQSMYGGGGMSRQADSSAMGGAAAMQALKMFTGGSGGGMGGGMGGMMGGMGGGGGGGQNAFVGLAMSEAAKLFDQQSSSGNMSAGANKQDAVSSAAQMAMKMYMKNQMGGGSSGGGGGGLMSLASKFL